MQDAIDPIYLRSLLNRATGQYATSIRAVVAHLFTTHGTIMPQQVKAKEQAIFGMHYDISQPVDVVFNSIEDLADLAEHANSPMSAQQQIDLAYAIFCPPTHSSTRHALMASSPVALWQIAHGPTCLHTSAMPKPI
jgi:hypothetical protein